MNLNTVKKTRHAVLGILLFGSANLVYAQTTTKPTKEKETVVTQQTNPSIEELKKQIAENPQNGEALVKLATAYQDNKDWTNALETWKKVTTILPEWAPAYYSQGYVFQSTKDNVNAQTSYEKYISLVKPEEVEANKKSLAYAHLFIAYTNFETNKDLAKQHIAKSLEYDPANEDAIKLNKALNPS